MTQMPNPIQAAKKLRYDLGWTVPNDYTLDEVAFALGAVVKEDDLQGSEGRIIMKGSSAIISVSNAIAHIGKRNFVIAHEIGHFTLHRNLKLFLDNNQTLSDWHKKGEHEQQANEFASELLMPSELFASKVTKKKLSINLIEEVAGYFSVSLTAAFLKYAALGDFPLMVIYAAEGKVKWKCCSKDFPFQYLPYNFTVPAWTVAGDFFGKKGLESKPVKIDAVEWFPDDYKLKYKGDWKLWEQCFQVSENGIISCLWSL